MSHVPGLTRLFRVLVVLVAILAAPTTAAHAEAQLSATVSDDPTQERTLTIQIDGATDADATLYAWVLTGSAQCQATAAEQSEMGTPSLTSPFGTFVTAGEFSLAYDDTPKEEGLHRVCGYLIDASSGDPDSAVVTSFTVRAPTVTLHASASADPVARKAVTITLAGSTEVGRRVFAWVAVGMNACAATPSEQSEISGPSLTGDAGESIATGDFSVAHDFVPPSVGTYRVCAFVAEFASWDPDATSARDVSVRAPLVSLTAQVSSGAVVARAAAIQLSGTSEIGGRLYAYANRGAQPCATTAGRQSAVSDAALTGAAGVSLPSGRFTSEYAFTPFDEGSYRICGYVASSASAASDASTSADFTVAPRPAATPAPTATPAPVLLAAAASNAPAAPALVAEPLAPYRAHPLTDSKDQFDRLRFRWRTDVDPESETLMIWDEEPAPDVAVVLSESIDSDELEEMSSPEHERDVRVRSHLGYRQFWWQVVATAPGGKTVMSDIGTVRVVPSPMVRSRVRVSTKLTLLHSLAKPGSVRLRVASSPRARVSIKVGYRGHVVATRHYTEGVGGLRGIDFPLSCSRTGQFSYEARIEDPYGNRVTRTGTWSSSESRCASFRAVARAKQRRAAEKRRRDAAARAPKPSPAPTSSGGNCDPNYSGACLKPDASDYDCAGGSGNGPYYVDGPITVVGHDHYGLDADGDGVACES